MEPAFLTKFVNQYLLPSIPGPMMARLLAVNSDEESDALSLLRMLDEHPEYRDLLLSVSLLKERVAEWTVEEQNAGHLQRTLLTRTVNLLGKANTRNALIGIKLKQFAGHDQLIYSLKAEEYCQDNGLPFADRGYIAGLHYDWIKGLMTQLKESADAKSYFELMWKQGLKTGALAHNIGSQIKNLKLGGEAFSAGLLLSLGPALMAIFFPKSEAKSWHGFNTECDKLGDFAGKIARFHREKDYFSVTHAELLADYVGFFGEFLGIERALRYYQTPYFLKKIDPDQCALASVLRLASQPGKVLTPSQKLIAEQLRLSEEKILAAFGSSI